MKPAPARVLHVVRPAEGGIRQHVLSLIGWTDRARFSLALAAPPDFLGTVPAADLLDIFPLPISPRFSPSKDLMAAAQLRSLTKTADLTHAHGLRAGWIAALAHVSLPFPFVVTAHNLIEPGGRLARLGLGLIGRRAVRVVAVSHAVADGLKAAGVPPSKISVIPNGIDILSFSELPDVQAARQRLSVPPAAFVVGCVARLSPEKGVDVLLRTARLTPGLLYLVAGDGPQRALLNRTLPGNVRLLGRIADTRVLLAAVDVLAVPSRLEGQGIVALEAMAAGVPVVASRVGGLAEMLMDGETALLVPPDDAEALAEALVQLRGDTSLGRQLAANGRGLAREKHDLGQMVRTIESLYDELMLRRD